MRRCLNYLLGVLIVAAMSACQGSVPTSPSSGPSSLPPSIEISASTPSGTTLRLVDCSDNWDIYSCFKDFQISFLVRPNQNAELAILSAEFLTSEGRSCGDSGAETGQRLFAGVVATFRTTAVYLKPDCFDRLPFQAAKVLVLVRADPTPTVSDGSVPVELMKQEFSIDYTFAR